jgi:drug/metabolite transporter (DMT)-like permease
MQWNKYTFFGFSAVLLWSVTVALVRSISEQLGPVTAGAAVYLTGGILSVGYLVFKNKMAFSIKKNDLKPFLATGGLFLIYTVSLFLALGLAKDRMQAIELGLVNYLWPTLTILFSLIILSRKAKFGLIPGTIFALIGVFLVLTQGSSFTVKAFISHMFENPMAYMFALIAAFSWAFYSNLTRLWSNREHSGFVPFFILITGVFLLLVSFFFKEEATFSLGVWIEVFFLSLTTVLAYGFWELSMQKGNIALVLSFSYLTPLFSTLVSTVYLGVLPGMNLWLGCVILIAGSFLSWKSLAD